MNLYASTIRTLVAKYPAVVPLLKGRARWIAFAYIRSGLETTKTHDYYLQQIERLIRSVYRGDIAGEFVDVLANLISGQLTQAYEQAWSDEEGEGDLPDYLTSSLEDMILGQYEHVDQLYRDIVDARVDETPIDPLLARAALWAQQWDVAYREALRLIQLENGGNLVWHKGATENGCSTCAALDGIVMSAREWQDLDVHPRGYPNPKLECEGGGPANNCDCSLDPTDQRRSPKAYSTVMNIVSQ